ncbi:3-dehydroquinate synthase, partial [Tyzzerella sp. OttesenSCG-928-J15]|nr:3-dehydroquinate synthase [Tyzzerella sp. OttesenSCG-928-J15]
KNLSSVETIYNKLMEAEFERSSVIVALGGGVTGDLAGFAAATYMRGIKYIQIPTTLLAQVDSSVGGKVGVDFCGAKNMVGTFYSPEMVYANTSTLSTLPKEHFLSGMGEIIKYGLIYDRGFLSFLANNADNIMNLRNDEIFHAIKRSVSIKAQVVACDERDNGIRRILNFGHTFGHAVESRLNYSLPHGICVGLGMVCAMYLSKVQGFIAENDYGFFIEIMSKYGLPLKVKGVNAGELYEMALKDKKVNDSKLTVILLDRIGSGFAEDNISKEQVLKAFEQII